MSEDASVIAVKELSAAINARAREIYEGNGDSHEDYTDAKDLARALARLLNGETLHSAFGAPGDWGYSSRIGRALQGCYAAGPSIALACFGVDYSNAKELASDGR